MELVEKGAVVHEGHWAKPSLEDGEVYLAAVKDAQAALIAEANTRCITPCDTDHRLSDQKVCSFACHDHCTVHACKQTY
jgi:hypothetical protein